jgi:hypothetical protein
VKVSGVVLPDVGIVERTESGRTTRRELEDSEKSEPAGSEMLFTPLFTNTAVVQIKLDPER